MSKDMIFTAYSVLKNEDAIPFACEGLLAVADGLGGAGSTVHEIDRERHADIESELLKTALAGISPRSIASEMDFIESELSPMLDSEADTSALWASRIALCRFVLGMGEGEPRFPDLSDNEARERLSAFIGEGLRSVAEHFGFEKGRYGGQVVLPTTLASLKYSDTGEDLLVEAVWAGDSRCYLIDADGIKQLTVDDEDSSGAITNLFYADGEDAKLNYRAYRVKKPCLLVALSDGAFDPYEPHDNLGVEYSLLSVMRQSESCEDFCQRLTEYYDEIHADDASFAFAAVGYGSFENMKKSLALRGERAERTLFELRRLSPAIKAMETDEEVASGYIYSRTRDKIDAIIRTLAPMAVAGEEDVALGEVIKNALDGVNGLFCDDGEEGAKKLGKLLSESPNKMDKYLKIQENRYTGEPYSELSALRKSAEEYIGAADFYEKKRLELAEASAEGQHLRAKVLDIIKGCEESYKRTVSERDSDSVRSVREELRREHIWKNALLCLIERTTCQCSMKMSFEDRVLLDSVNRYIARASYLERGALGAARSRLEQAKGRYERAVNSLCALTYENTEARAALLTPEGLALFGREKPIDTKQLAEALGEVLSEKKEQLISDVVKNLAASPERESCIDLFYNGTRLAFFREFYLRRKNPSEEALSFSKELSSYENATLALIAEDKDA